MDFHYPTKENVHNRACAAVGKTMRELITAMDNKASAKKSQVGYAWESWFGRNTSNLAGKDLIAADVELKSTGVIDTKNGKSAKERLVLNVINYIDEYQTSFYNSSFWAKNNRMEICFYAYDKEKNWLDFEVLKTILFEFPENDLRIIQQDFDVIQQYINTGRAHELSESLTMYLGACPKGANKHSVRDQHPDLNAPKAMQRAYCLKNSYMTYLVRNYVFGDLKDERIRTNPFDDKVDIIPVKTVNESLMAEMDEANFKQYANLEEYINTRVEKWIGKSQSEIATIFGILPDAKGNFPKNINAMLVSRMLGIKGNIEKTEEFQKAGVVVKTIRVEHNGTIEQHMSFPAFKFKELARETWEDSTLKTFFESTKFFFVVFKKDAQGELFFQGTKFFTILQSDIDGKIKAVWQDTVDKLNEGVVLKNTAKNPKSKPIISNNFIKASEQMITHVRPHATTASYIANSGSSDELPVKAKWEARPAGYSDSWMTSQCFWLNNDYILEHVKDLI